MASLAHVSATVIRSKRYRWWHGVAFYAGVQAASFGLRLCVQFVARRRGPEPRQQDREFYRTERLPKFAPPGSAFPIAWGVNSVTAVAGGLHVLNLPAETPGRTKFLRLQALCWTLFSTFNAAYFGLRSPINAEIVTLLYSGATVASVNIAWRQMRDRAVTLSLVPTAAWLLVANPVGITQAAWNHDPFWNAGPFVEAPANWVKR